MNLTELERMIQQGFAIFGEIIDGVLTLDRHSEHKPLYGNCTQCGDIA